jgi:general secretion pathway protein D
MNTQSQAFRNCFIAALLVSVLASANTVSAKSEPDEPDSAVSILNGDVELRALVDLAAERLDLNVEYDRSSLRGQVTFRLGEPLTDTELWNLTNRLLASRGFTTIRRAGEKTLSVVAMGDAAELAEIEEIGRAGGEQQPSAAVLPGFRVVTLEVAFADPERVLTILETFRSEAGGNLTQVGTTDRIVIADLTPRVEQMLRVVSEIDELDATVAVERFRLQSISTASLIPKVTQLIAKRQLAGAGKLRGEVLQGSSDTEILIIAPSRALATWRSLIETLDRDEVIQTRTYRPQWYGLEEVRELIEGVLSAEFGSGGLENNWTIVSNELIGTLVITATPSEHERIGLLLAELADIPATSRQTFRRFVLQNRDAGEVRDLVEELLGGGTGVRATDPGYGEQQDPATAPPLPMPVTSGPSGEPAMRISVDEGTNSLLATADPRLLDQIGALIDQLDVRRPQVMIEVLLVTLTDGETFDLGVELQSLVSDSGTLVALGSLFGLSDLEPFTDSGDVASVPGLGGTAVVLNPGEFSAVVRALETVNQGRSLSQPKVLVNDNETASLDAVQQEPFLSTNASDTVATTSFGGFESAGTTVSVTPQIAEGDHLSLQYTITLSSFTGESPDASTPPPRQQNSINSVATIPDGHTIAVGGIEIRTQGEAESRVPGIGSIPLIGELFKNRSRSGSTSTFYAFIRADVLRHDSFADLKHISAPIRESMEIDDDYPVLLPRVIR